VVSREREKIAFICAQGIPYATFSFSDFFYILQLPHRAYAQYSGALRFNNGVALPKLSALII